MPVRVLHMSDFHFGRETSAVIDGLLEQLELVQPDAVIISGDLTQRAKTGEFRRARDLIEKIHQPLLVVPGNHDLSTHRVVERLVRPWQKWRRFISVDLEPVLHIRGMTALGINSARRTGLYLDWSRGRINESQLHHIAQQTGGLDNQQLRMVVVHHPFWLPPGQEKRELIGNRDRAIMQMAQSDIDVILSGHVHVAYTQTLEGVVISHAGTAISNRLRPGHVNSFNIIHGDRKSLQIKTMAWGGKHFEQADVNRFKRDGGNWEAVEHST